MVVLELYKTHFTEPYPSKTRITLRFSIEAVRKVLKFVKNDF